MQQWNLISPLDSYSGVRFMEFLSWGEESKICFDVIWKAATGDGGANLTWITQHIFFRRVSDIFPTLVIYTLTCLMVETRSWANVNLCVRVIPSGETMVLMPSTEMHLPQQTRCKYISLICNLLIQLFSLMYAARVYYWSQLMTLYM